MLFAIVYASIVQAAYQTCFNMEQYGACSTNSACGCLHHFYSNSLGLCGFVHDTCSDFVPCGPPLHSCNDTKSVCLSHPRCHNLPICYPVLLTAPEICPPVTSQLAATSPSTEIAAAMTTTAMSTKDCPTVSGKLLGNFIQSHNYKHIEITLSSAKFDGRSYPLTWLESHAFYFTFEKRFWYYIRNGRTYEVILHDHAYHILNPIS
ncbi:unnamed protein product [Rotaria socialis]|uniref:Uncharacterized protein n=1 Tax=Rotaria socialis TaxID=392032 RepID=A0A821G3S9_9BILA|nr:unnamed protein product [Rotaria socialis]